MNKLVSTRQEVMSDVTEHEIEQEKALLPITKQLLRFYVDSQGHNNFTDECKTIIEAAERSTEINRE